MTTFFGIVLGAMTMAYLFGNGMRKDNLYRQVQKENKARDQMKKWSK